MNEKIFVSPSNQSDNTYAYGNTNEAAECGKIAAALEEALKRCGFEVKVMQWESAQARCKAANEWGAALYIPIHTNAYNGKVTGTRIFVLEKKGEAYDAAKAIYNELAPITPGRSENISTYPELIEIKQSKAPSVYIEAEFHDNKEAAKWITENSVAMGEAICKGVCKHFGVAYVAADPEEESQKWTELPEHYDTAKAGTYKVNTDDGLFFRIGPSTEHKALKLLEGGTVVKCLGHYSGVWLRVETADSCVGFCHSDYLTKIKEGQRYD